MPSTTFAPPPPDPDDNGNTPLSLPPTVERLLAGALAVRGRTDQSQAPPLDDHARDLIRQATWDMLPLEAAAHIELNVIRYQTWAEAAADESLRRLAADPLSGPTNGGGGESPGSPSGGGWPA